jgi:hypothetical protein
MDNPQAFPLATTAETIDTPGMTLRDWFAGQALGAIITATSNGQHYPAREGQSLIEGMAQDAYELADTMLAERAKETDNAHD